MEHSFKKLLPLFEQFGIDPTNLDSEKMEKLMKISENFNDPKKITPQIANEILDTIGIKRESIKRPPKSAIKIGRNEPCICESGKKYKKCCGEDLVI
jgi:preprotein translocase subunit SecA